MIRTGDHAFVKELNKSIVLGVLRTQSPVSRTDISKRTGLNKATVSVIMEELLSADLVVELGHGPSSVGRRPVLCQFNPQAGTVIGVQLDVDGVLGVCTDLSATVLERVHVAVPSMAETDHAIGAIERVVHSLIHRAPSTKLGLIGIGVGVPGLVNYITGNVLRAPNLHWAELPLRAMLESRLDFPVFVDNEANTGALAEMLLGKGIGVSNLVYLSMGHGVGAGIIVNGQLVRGVHGLAGEFGHMTIEADGHPCSCEGRGCLEMYASEKAIATSYRDLTGERLPIGEIVDRTLRGDSQGLQAMESAGRYLGIGLSNIANALDTSLIVVGHRLGRCQDTLLPAVQRAFDSYCFSRALSKTRIEPSDLGPDACAVGASSLVLQEYFTVPTVQ